MYTEITMQIGRYLGIVESKDKLKFSTQTYNTLAEIELMNDHIQEENLFQVMYQESWDGYQLIIFTVVPKGEEEKGKRLLIESATEQFGKKKARLQKMIDLLNQ